jgi:hypothetical protein
MIYNQIEIIEKYVIVFSESLILFLAAGDNAGGGDPVDIIKTENEARNNSVTILTYSFGQGKYAQ